MERHLESINNSLSGKTNTDISLINEMLKRPKMVLAILAVVFIGPIPLIVITMVIEAIYRALT
jgi:hypothetical protein